MTLRRNHVADGGYVDNEGAVSVVAWIGKLLDRYYPQDKPPKAPPPLTGF